MVEFYTQKYEIPSWGKIYINSVSSNSGDSISVNILKNGKKYERLYEATNISEAESYLEGFLEHLARTNKNIPSPNASERKKGWSELYLCPVPIKKENRK